MKKVLLLIFLLITQNVSAQLVPDDNAMYDRMDRLERDVTLLQRKIYRPTNSSPQVVETYVTSAQPIANDGSLENLYMKLDQMEKVVASLTGQVEELSHELSETKKELKKTNNYVDVKLAELNKKKEVPKAQEKKPTKPEKKADKETKKEDVKKEPKEVYDAAYKLLNEQKYAEAQIALEDFIEKYPNDTLAGNAQYWLGETFYVRGMYELAAVAFAKGFKTYKTGSKGADSLFKLGLTMEKLEKKKEACTAFKNIKKEFPKASDSLLSKAKKEMEKLGCDQ